MKQATKILTLLALLLMTSCHDEPEIVSLSFKATIERPATESSTPASKVYLHNEEWIYWEIGDVISVASDATESPIAARLNKIDGSEEDYNGIFEGRLPDASTKFLALYPHSINNVISSNFSTVTLDLPATQYRRDDSKADFTFDRAGFPMVAWFDGTNNEEKPNFDFHALAGLVRLQFFDASGATPKSIQSIDIVADKQISGLVNVAAATTDNPRPVSTLNTDASKKVTMNCGDGGLSLDDLRSFYLVLPAYGGENVTTEYSLDITIHTTDEKQCKKSMNPKVRRRSICYPQAMGITEWVASGDGSASPGVSGNGTAERPFKVYTIKDLKYVRDCYNSVERKINGIAITPDTYIKIMRSDIVLNTTGDSAWNVGIRNFEGHMTALTNNMQHPGIIDSCYNVPLFESIGADGVVEGITLKCATTNNITNPTGVSPFCMENAGVIRNCAVTYIPDKPSKFNLSIFSPFAGICVINTGTIEGCRFEGKVEVQSGQNFAGICLHNQSGGEIIGCQSSNMTVRFVSPASKAVGICYENASGATVKDCYFASDITGYVNDWAGIVYDNSGTVEHCYLSSTGHIYTTGRVGGIVRINRAGKVDYCWLNSPLRGRMVGGIVDSLAAGTVINCFNRSSAMITTTNAASVGGGLVGVMTGGTIANSYVDEIVIMLQASGSVVGGIVGKATGGTVTNCYSYEAFNHFYGTTSGVTYNYCYIVDGTMSGTDIPSISWSLATSPTGTTGCLVDLLNDHVPYLVGKNWKNTSGELPELVTYTVSQPSRR